MQHNVKAENDKYILENRAALRRHLPREVVSMQAVHTDF